MFDKKINFKKLHQDLSNTYKRQMEIKKEFPHRFQYPTYDWDNRGALYKAEMEVRKPWQKARVEFIRLSGKMTMLCCILNHAKGKLHMKKLTKRSGLYGWESEEITLEDQADFIGSTWKDYVVEEEDDDRVVDEFIVPFRKKSAVKKSFVQRLLRI